MAAGRVAGAHPLKAVLSRAQQKLRGEGPRWALAGGQGGNESRGLGWPPTPRLNGTHLLETASQGGPPVSQALLEDQVL